MSVRETVQYFDMEQMMPGCTVLIVGKRCTGKSVLEFDILAHMSGWFSFGLALTPTQSSKERFEQCMPSAFIDVQSPERLEQHVSMAKAMYNRASTKGEPTRASFVVLDDTAFDDRFMRCKPLQELWMNGRQFGCTCLCVSQYIMKCSPTLRCNSDFVFLFWDNNQKNQEMLWKYWGGMMDKATFYEVFSECTQDYSVLVIDVRRSATSRDWRDCVFWYKADTAPRQFSLCDKDFFKLDKYCRVEDAEEREVKATTTNKIMRLGPDGLLYNTASLISGKIRPAMPSDTTLPELPEPFAIEYEAGGWDPEAHD